ncbi:MAG: N-acetyltransferase [Acidimicrobiia bacterium]|nr:N-acetyltransferase [Acidimicrobiia bacterium]NNL48369.1 N-acetyltransferase [Acidimicrobiia bacterium]
MTEVRPATADDVPSITAIYNHWITETHVSFDAEPQTIEERTAWFSQYAESGRYRVFVAEQNGQLVGVTYSSKFRPKASYETTVETTVVVDPAAVGLGIGRVLLSHLVEALQTEDVHRAVALIALPNQPSVTLHEQLGYRTVGIHDEVGRKFGRFWSVQIMERAFS